MQKFPEKEKEEKDENFAINTELKNSWEILRTTSSILQNLLRHPLCVLFVDHTVAEFKVAV